MSRSVKPIPPDPRSAGLIAGPGDRCPYDPGTEDARAWERAAAEAARRSIPPAGRIKSIRPLGLERLE